jgi:adenylate kinase
MEKLGFNLILLGQIAAGKDTQAELLKDKYAFKPVESGKYWRKILKEKSERGDWLRRTTGKGLPAPVALMKEFLITNIEKKPKNKDLLFVGNPRLKPEAQLLKKLLSEKKQDFFALYITISDKEVYSRSNLRNREAGDVDKKYIQNRIKYHKEQVSKTVAYFDSLGKLKKINGNQPIEKVSQDIEKAIVSYKKLCLKKNM